MDISDNMDGFSSASHYLESNDIQILSEHILANGANVCTETVLTGRPNSSQQCINSHLCQLCKLIHRHANSVSNEPVASDNVLFLKMLDRFNIHIPKYNDNLNRKQGKRKNRKKSSHRTKKRSRYKSKRSPRTVSPKQRFPVNYCSRSVAKLLLLNLYLRYLEKDRYSKCAPKI